MQTLDIGLAAGELKTFDIGGAYFEFIEGQGAVDINFVDSSGSRAKDLEMLGALPGYWVAGAFSRFEIKNQLGQAQTLRIMFGNGTGGSRRIQGNVSIVDRVQQQCQSVSAADLTLGFAATAIVAPGANTKGVILRASICEVQAGASGSANLRLIAAATAPASLVPGANSIILNSVATTVTGSVTGSYLFDQRREVPAGWGIYLCKNHLTAAALTCSVSLSCEVL